MVIFVVPAYNEEENIELLLKNLDLKMKQMNLDYRVILVNDGSIDSTMEKALTFIDSMPLEIINHEINKGVGQVFRTGLSRALELARNNDIIVTKEADNTSDLDILSKMIEKIYSGDEVVLASCYAPGGKIIGTTIIRIILSFWANFIIKVLFSIKSVHTYSSFYRAYKTETLRKAFKAYQNKLIEDDGFTCMVEMLIKLSRLPIKITEVPMVLRCNFRKGTSKMNKSKNIIDYFSLISKELRYSRNNIKSIVARYKGNV